MRSPHCASRINFAKPCSSTPARMRESTCSRLDFSRTIVSMPCRCRSCDSSRPDGPPPMMQTWTFIWFPPAGSRWLAAVWTNLSNPPANQMDGPRNLLYNSNMTELSSRRSIESYNLFGEARDLPDVVHCETIAARSVLHEWEFAAHRHARLHQILLIERGGGQASLEERSYPLRPMRVVNVPVGHVHGFSFSRGTEGFVLTIAAEMLDEVLIPAEGL